MERCLLRKNDYTYIYAHRDTNWSRKEHNKLYHIQKQSKKPQNEWTNKINSKSNIHSLCVKYYDKIEFFLADLIRKIIHKRILSRLNGEITLLIFVWVGLLFYLRTYWGSRIKWMNKQPSCYMTGCNKKWNKIKNWDSTWEMYLTIKIKLYLKLLNVCISELVVDT